MRKIHQNHNTCVVMYFDVFCVFQWAPITIIILPPIDQVEAPPIIEKTILFCSFFILDPVRKKMKQKKKKKRKEK